MCDQTTWLSILLPVHNVEPYLEECVHSIARQAGGDGGIEVIIVDDCSTDRSGALAERLCQQYPQLLRLVCYSHNQGVSAARNRLLDEACGEYIWFVDPDDYILDNAISELRAIMARHKPDLILCDYRKNRYWKRRSFFGPTRTLCGDLTKLVAGVFKSRKMYCCVRVSRRAVWGEDLRFPVGRVFEDVATTPWLLLRTRSYFYMPKAWVHYRQRPGSIMDSVRRQPYLFDAVKHDDLAQALSGYKDGLQKFFGVPDTAIDYHVADFCAKEFTKTAHRIMRAEQSRHDICLKLETLARFRSAWQSCSPISFERLTIHYLKRLRLIRYALLRYFLHKSQARSHTGSDLRR